MKRLSLLLGLASILLVPACALPDLPALPDGGGATPSDTGVDDVLGNGGGDAPSPDASIDSADATSDAGLDAGAIGVLGAGCPSSGALACAGNAQSLVIACTAGVWTSVMTCPQGQNCDSRLGLNQGTCAAIDPLCTSATPGGNVCSDSTTVVQCGPDLVSDTPVTTCISQGCVNGACTGMCAPGTTQCSGNGVQTCGSDGTWGIAVACSNATCSKGVCSGSCSAGAVQCSGTSAVQACVSGMWGTPTPCTNQACVAGACSGTCSPSTTECTSDTQMATCTDSGTWGSPTTCTEACVGALDTVPGSCGGVCVPGATECTSDTQIATCGANGQWGAATTCANACVAASATCGGVCVPGTTECTSDTQLATCGTGGQWETPAATCTYACLGTLNTVPGSCGGTCVPNSTQCTGSTAYQTCGPLGTWVATTTCTASAPYCSISNGTCGPPPNVIFVTSTFVNGNLGGLAGADATCQAAAQGASLPGTFIAYLSTSTISAASRVQNARGWVRTDGLPVADTGADLAAGSLFYPIALDQKGNPTTTTNSWQATGTTYQGVVYSGDTCGDWTSSAAASSASAGSPWAGYSGFENYFYLSCSQSFRLVCLQVSQNVQVSVNKMAGRYAFVASGWSPATGGLAAADSTCQSAATGAGLPGTYSALLATSTASAASRFSTTGATWVRPDGLPVFATASALDTMTVVAPIVLNASGGYQGNYALWSGAATPTTTGTLASTCDNWASNSADGGTPPAAAGVTGFTQAPGSGGSAWGYTTLPCSATYGTVYCLQQ